MSMTNVIIYGTGQRGQAVCENFSGYFNKEEYVLAGFLDSDPAKAGTWIQGHPVLTLADARQMDYLLILIAIASSKAREEVEALLTVEGLGTNVFSFDGSMNRYYTSEIHTQILIALLKAHRIRKIIVSPGTTNISLTASLQRDAFFKLYSAPDERSGAYMACGLAEESKEPVVLSCTGATASRNYLPGLTEAYYSKLPVLAITSSQHTGRAGQLFPQMIDRSHPPKDAVNLSVDLPVVYSSQDKWACEVKVNRALLELKRKGGGPVHINLQTTYSKYFTRKSLPKLRRMERFTPKDQFPELKAKRVCIFVGAHKQWSDGLHRAVERFCEKYHAVVFCDHTSNYQGKYRVFASLLCQQEEYEADCRKMEVMIHMGEVSGVYVKLFPAEVWRVSPDGEIRDTFQKLRYIFEMPEELFFEAYVECSSENNLPGAENGKPWISPAKTTDTYLQEWQRESQRLQAQIPRLPFSNLWIASQTSHRLPDNSTLHLGILNTLRAWNYFEVPASVYGHANTGGFGIDGCLSTAAGAALADPNRLVFCILGDLAFFYDMNVLGNRHVGRNLRLLVINNGCGAEFKNYPHMAAMFGEDANAYIAAAGHYGNKSRNLLKAYAENLGFLYESAQNKEEYLDCLPRFVHPGITQRPILLEVFTDSEEESRALKMMRRIYAEYIF